MNDEQPQVDPVVARRTVIAINCLIVLSVVTSAACALAARDHVSLSWVLAVGSFAGIAGIASRFFGSSKQRVRIFNPTKLYHWIRYLLEPVVHSIRPAMLMTLGLSCVWGFYFWAGRVNPLSFLLLVAAMFLLFRTLLVLCVHPPWQSRTTWKERWIRFVVFRQEYRSIMSVAKTRPNCPVPALVASATQRYGPHTMEVEEVIEMVRSGRILNMGQSPAELNVKVIQALPSDRRLSPQEQKQAYEWHDIRSKEAGAYYGRSSVPEAIEKMERYVLPEVAIEIAGILRPKLSKKVGKGHLREIINDLYACAAERAAFGVKPGFWENLLKVYASGGYPCGWEGQYPQGQMVVYYPPEVA